MGTRARFRGRTEGKPGIALFVAWIIAMAPVLAVESGPTVLGRGLFSYQAPSGWRVSESPTYPIAEGTGASKGARISVSLASAPKGLPALAAPFLKPDSTALDRVHLVTRNKFYTDAGLDGTRVELKRADDEEVLYFFDLGSGRALVVTASCPAAKAPLAVPLFDAGLKGFTLE